MEEHIEYCVCKIYTEKKKLHTLFVSLDFTVDLNMVNNMSANDGAFRMCIALMRALYPLCRKGNRFKCTTVIIFEYFTHFKMFPLFNWKLNLVNNFHALTLSTSTLYRVFPEYIRYIPSILAQIPGKLTESFRCFPSWHSEQMQIYIRLPATHNFVVTIDLITVPHSQDLSIK